MHMDRIHFDVVLSAIEELSDSGNIENPDELLAVICDRIDLPKGNAELSEILLHPQVIRSFVESNYIKPIFETDDLGGSKGQKFLEFVGYKPPSEELIRVRRFRSIGGRYPAQDFRTSDGTYGLIDFEPFLITSNPIEWQKEEFNAELGSLTRGEIKLLASMMFSLFAGGPFLYFQFSDHIYDLHPDLLLTKQEDLSGVSLRRAKTVTQILDRIKPPSHGWFELSHDPSGRYEFTSHQHEYVRLNKLNSSFDLTNELALRTAFLMIKAASLWTTGGRVFSEDALADLLFGLEGCLHLVHQRFAPGTNFEIEPTLEHVEVTFPHFPGYVGILQDSYEKRIQIVHPENRIDSSWIPNLWAEDFYDNFGLGTDLFYYSLTGDVLPESP